MFTRPSLSSRDLAQRALLDLVHETADRCRARNKRTGLDAGERLTDVGVRVGERLQCERRANAGVRLDLRFHVVVAEREHPAIRVVDEDDLASAEQSLRDGQRPDDVVRDNSTRIADDVRVALAQPEQSVGVEPRVHARHDRDMPRRRHRKLALVEILGVTLGVVQKLVGDRHAAPPDARRNPICQVRFYPWDPVFKSVREHDRTQTEEAPMIDYEAFDRAVGQNWYRLDPELQRRVRQGCPPDDLGWAEAKLDALGALVGTRIARNADTIDAHPPRLVRYDRWASEVDEVEHHPAMLDSKRAMWECGYVSGFAADEARRGHTTPGVVIAAAHYLVSQADTGLVCSTGMTSGVAGLVDSYAPPDVRAELLAGLRADRFESGIDGSMFLTERDGGSDLGRTVHCVAHDLGDGRVQIDGEKWFCSNVDGEAIVMLARPEGASEGSAGLGLYLVPAHLEDGSRNHFRIRRLKEKLGTRSVPTAEVEFDGAVAYALRAQPGDGAGTDAQGLNRMMEMVNGSRFGVAMMGLGIARRCFLESAIWAHHRRAKGRPLVDLPLAREQLVDLLVELEAAMALGFECAVVARRDDGARLRRALIPAAKARLCRFGVQAASATIEFYGGNGYCEDWGLTRQLRDAQCHPIWEGTENICVLDVLRSMRRDAAHEAVLARIDDALAIARGGAPSFAQPATDAVAGARDELARRIDDVLALDRDESEARSAGLVRRLIETVSTALLLEDAVDDPHKALVALRYARRHLIPDSEWTDRIAVVAARELLAYDAIDGQTAAKAAA